MTDPFMSGALARLPQDTLIAMIIRLREDLQREQARRIQSDRERGAAHVEAQLGKRT